MIETFTALLAAHCLADFTLQSKWMVRHKKRLSVILLHIAVVGITAALALGGAPLALLSILIVSHLIIDAVKTWWLKDTLLTFAADQALHVAVIAALAAAWPGTFDSWWWAHLLTPPQQAAYMTGLILMTGVIVNLHGGAIVVRKATARFDTQVRSPIRGLQNGGAWIGFLERAMIMLFILSNQAAGVGFLITAKSILRFGDVKNTRQRKSTEYIIIGTFMSFAWALLVTLVTQYALKYVAA